MNKSHHIRRLDEHGFSRAAIARYVGVDQEFVRAVLYRERKAGVRKMPWTPNEDEKLAQLVVDGLSDAAAAQELSRTRHAVRLRRQRVLGLETARSPGRRRVHCRRTIGELMDRGKTAKEIAAETGASEWSVRRIIREITP